MSCRLNVVVPVYNGANEVAETIARVAEDGGDLINLTIVVNGSTDHSMAVAEAALERVSTTLRRANLIELNAASRSEALNAGDRFAAPGAHHLYLDQDVRVSSGGLLRIVEALDQGAHFVGAGASWRTSSKTIRAAMEAWNTLPYVVEAPVTAGMYAVSAEGRSRWPGWPATLPDDKFARLNFSPGERLRLGDVEYSVAAPSSFTNLVKARVRYARSNEELRRMAPNVARRDGGRGLENLNGVRSSKFYGLAVLTLAEVIARASLLGVR